VVEVMFRGKARAARHTSPSCSCDGHNTSRVPVGSASADPCVSRLLDVWPSICSICVPVRAHQRDVLQLSALREHAEDVARSWLGPPFLLGSRKQH
jgi:hypothetical protein